MSLIIKITLLIFFSYANLSCAHDMQNNANFAIGNKIGDMNNFPTDTQTNGTSSQKIANLKDVVKAIPKIKSITQGITKIDFLQNTLLANNSTINASANPNTISSLTATITAISDKTYLGRAGNSDVFYIKKLPATLKLNAQNNNKIIGSSANNPTNLQQNYIITYNHRRNLLGIFRGIINIKVKEINYINQIIKIYPLQKIISTGKYASFKLNHVADINSIHKALATDKNIESFVVKIKENKIVKH